MISLVPSIFLIRNTFFLHKFAEKPAKKAIAVMSIMNDNIESKSPFERPRSVVKKLLSKEQPEGDGALVRRSIGRPELRNLDPFLLLDEFTGRCFFLFFAPFDSGHFGSFLMSFLNFSFHLLIVTGTSLPLDEVSPFQLYFTAKMSKYGYTDIKFRP